MIRIVRAKQVKINIRNQMSILFVDSFYGLFESICKDRMKLSKAFKHIFNLDNFYVVLLDNNLIGMGACSDGDSSINFKKSKLIRYLGISNGNRLYKYLKTVLEDRDYSFVIDNKCGLIEFIMVDRKYWDKKIGFTLVNHIMFDNNYERYIAKVANNNYRALRIFENIDFEEFDKEQATVKEKEDIGVDYYLYLIGENKASE